MLHVFHIEKYDYLPYYLNGVYVPGRQDACWHGVLASDLALPARPHSEIIKKLINREIDAQWTKARKDVRHGLNLTFSAPKSASIAALVIGDERVLHAHEQAVMAALDYLQTGLHYRQTENGKVVQQRAFDTLSAVFHRCVSRDGDPHLHSQIILFNLCRRKDGKFCALDVAMVFHAKLVYGLAYRSEMARLLADTGIAAQWADDLWDLPGFGDHIKAAFSRRRHEIEDALEAEGIEDFDTPAAHVRAVARHTAPHAEINAKTLTMWQSEWRERCPALTSFSPPERYVQFPNGAGEFDAVMPTFLRMVGDKTGVSRHKLVQAMLIDNQGYLPVNDIENDIDALIDDGDIISAGFPPTLFTLAGYAMYCQSKVTRRNKSTKKMETS